jgi:ABC-2 type transport system ATP-binding protein
MTLAAPQSLIQAASPQAPTGAALVSVSALTFKYPAVKSRRRDDFKQRGPNSWSSSSAPRELALDDVSLEIKPAEMFAVLGPNGGGKSTLFRILATLAKPTQGSATIAGFDVAQAPDEVRKRIGVVFQAPSLDIKLTAYENLLHQGHLYGIQGSTLQDKIQSALATVGLQDRAKDFAETFSGGMKRRLEIAKSLLHSPRILLLDEPTTGLDPGARRELWLTLLKMRDTTGLAVALTTHLMDEADKCDRVAILSSGKLIACDSPAALKAQIGAEVLVIVPQDQSGLQEMTDAIASAFGPWSEKGRPQITDGGIRMEHHDGATLLPKIASMFPGRFATMSVSKPTLDDVFHRLTGKSM